MEGEQRGSLRGQTAGARPQAEQRTLAAGGGVRSGRGWPNSEAVGLGDSDNGATPKPPSRERWPLELCDNGQRGIEATPGRGTATPCRQRARGRSTQPDDGPRRRQPTNKRGALAPLPLCRSRARRRPARRVAERPRREGAGAPRGGEAGAGAPGRVRPTCRARRQARTQKRMNIFKPPLSIYKSIRGHAQKARGTPVGREHGEGMPPQASPRVSQQKRAQTEARQAAVQPPALTEPH